MEYPVKIAPAELIKLLKLDPTSIYCSPVPYYLSRREIWNDEVFLKRLKEAYWYSMDELAWSRNAAHNVLRFLLTGKPELSGVHVIHQFICALEWFDDGFSSASLVVKDFMMHIQNMPRIYEAIDSLSKEDLISEFKNRLSLLGAVSAGNHPLSGAGDVSQTQNRTSPCINLGMSTNGLINLTPDEAIKMVEQYYDLIEVYYSAEKRVQAISGEMNKSISFVRSLYVLVLILLRYQAKNLETVLNYIRKGSYMRIAKELVNSPGDVLFSINPELSERCLNRNLLNSHSIYYILLGIYCGMKEGISSPHVVNTDGEVPATVINPLLVPGAQRYSSLVNLLEGGCMLQLRYTGIPIIKFIEELSHLSSKSVNDVLDILRTASKYSTSNTVGNCQTVARIYVNYAPRWSKSGDIIYYHPAETTWKYCKLFTQNVFPELSVKYNNDFIYRLVSIIAYRKPIDVSKIMCLKRYIREEIDDKYIGDISKELFHKNKI